MTIHGTTVTVVPEVLAYEDKVTRNHWSRHGRALQIHRAVREIATENVSVVLSFPTQGIPHLQLFIMPSRLHDRAVFTEALTPDMDQSPLHANHTNEVCY